MAAVKQNSTWRRHATWRLIWWRRATWWQNWERRTIWGRRAAWRASDRRRTASHESRCQLRLGRESGGVRGRERWRGRGQGGREDDNEREKERAAIYRYENGEREWTYFWSEGSEILLIYSMLGRIRSVSEKIKQTETDRMKLFRVEILNRWSDGPTQPTHLLIFCSIFRVRAGPRACVEP